MRLATRPLVLASLLSLALGAACGTNPSSHDDAGDNDAGNGDAGSSSDGGNDAGGDGGGSSGAGNGDGGSGDAGAGDGGSCALTSYTGTPDFITPGAVTATLLDASGAPIAGANVSVTGINLSYPGTTASDGSVTLDVPAGLDRPAFRFGDGLSYAELLVPIPGANTAVGTVHTVALPATGAAMSAGGSASSGPATLTFAANADIEIDTLDDSTASQQQFRAAELPVALADIDSSVGIERVIGLGPLGTTVCPPATLSVSNALNWAAGTQVDVYILGTDVGQLGAGYGKWAQISSGQVSADGTVIETGSAGLPVLMTLGLKRH